MIDRHRLDPPPRSLDRDAFLARFGGVYEHSPWIAAAAFDAGLGPATDSAEGLAAAMEAVVDAAPKTAQLALLRAHPDLAGRLAVAGALTAHSAAEQAGAGLDSLSAAEYDRFHALNTAYVARFGFPFIIAVQGLDRHRILDAFERRSAQDRASEFAEALSQVHRIAYLRLCRLGPA